jgi:hypothetical protein
MKITRRALAATLTSAAALAQTQPATPATPDQELQAARGRVKANSEALAKQEVPMSTEPAFQFKA